MSAYIALHAHRRPHAPAVSNGDVTIDFITLDAHLRRVTHALRQLGLAPGSLVALGHEDVYAHLLLLLAFGDLGMVVEQFRPGSDVADRMGFEGVMLVVCSQSFPDGLHPRVLNVDLPRWRAMLATVSPSTAPANSRRFATEPMLVLHSSGTTGRPKRILVTRGMLDQRIRRRARMVGIGARPRCLVALPLGVAGQLYLTMACLRLGGALVLSVDERLPAALAADRVTHAVLLPYQLEEWLRRLGPDALPSPALTLVVIGGRLPATLRQAALGRLSGNIVSIYSSNEAGSICLVDADGVAAPVQDVELQLLAEEGAPARSGEIGCVHVRGPGVAVGYLATGLTLRCDFLQGWRSGDMARLLPDGQLSLLGRLDDLANLGGVKIPCADIENLISRRLGLQQVAVLMREDACFRQVMVVCVEPPPAFDAPAAQNSLRTLIKGTFELHAVDSIPRTPEGKIRRQALSRQLA